MTNDLVECNELMVPEVFIKLNALRSKHLCKHYTGSFTIIIKSAICSSKLYKIILRLHCVLSLYLEHTVLEIKLNN